MSGKREDRYLDNIRKRVSNLLLTNNLYAIMTKIADNKQETETTEKLIRFRGDFFSSFGVSCHENNIYNKGERYV